MAHAILIARAGAPSGLRFSMAKVAKDLGCYNAMVEAARAHEDIAAAH